jgi:hypothetical protein
LAWPACGPESGGTLSVSVLGSTSWKPLRTASVTAMRHHRYPSCLPAERRHQREGHRRWRS